MSLQNVDADIIFRLSGASSRIIKRPRITHFIISPKSMHRAGVIIARLVKRLKANHLRRRCSIDALSHEM